MITKKPYKSYETKTKKSKYSVKIGHLGIDIFHIDLIMCSRIYLIIKSLAIKLLILTSIIRSYYITSKAEEKLYG